MEIRDFLLSVQHRLAGLREARALYAARLAPDFNALGLLWPDEERLSWVIADLLNPKGSHAQGAVFLESFLKRFDLDHGFLPLPARVEVRTEKTTDRLSNSMRRMDIHIDFDSRVALVIENKPWAGDQNHQIKDYLDQLARSHRSRHCLVYLSGSGEPPASNSLPESDRLELEANGRFKTIRYAELIDWLRDCRVACRAERVEAFLNEFSDYIQREFLGVRDMTELSQIVDIALANNGEALQAALEIAHAQYEIKYRLLELLKQQLEDNSDNLGLEWNLKKTTFLDKYTGFGLCLRESQRYRVFFGFDRTQCMGFYYGIEKKDEHLPDLPKVRACLNQAITECNKETVWNPWWCWVLSPYDNWSKRIEPWSHILSGEMAKDILERTRKIHDALKTDGLLSQLD